MHAHELGTWGPITPRYVGTIPRQNQNDRFLGFGLRTWCSKLAVPLQNLSAGFMGKPDWVPAG